jgi:hypothetical protein
VQIQPEGTGIPEAKLSAANAPITGLPKLDLAALIQQLNACDMVTFLDVAASDLAKLAQILQPTEIRIAADQPQAHPATIVAKIDAEVKLDQAEHAIELAGGQKLVHWETSPQTLLHIGHRLYNAGGYANYMRAAAVGETIQSAYWGATLIIEQPLPVTRIGLPKYNGLPQSRAFAVAFLRKMPECIRVLWRRAPLLVLLLSWLAIGIAGGILFSAGFGFDFWALGFLGLVGFGFYSTIRKPN